MSDYDYQLRIVLSGDTGVGKSCLLNTLCSGEFAIPPLTVGVDQQYHTIQFQNKRIKLQIIDTAGNHRFRGLTKSFYKGVAAAVIVYDVTQRSTFNEVKAWLEDCLLQCEPNTTILLLGNKCDIVDKRQVSTEEGEEYARKNRMLFYEASAREQDDMLTVVKIIVDHVYCTLMAGKTSLSHDTGIRDQSMEPLPEPEDVHSD